MNIKISAFLVPYQIHKWDKVLNNLDYDAHCVVEILY